MAKFNGKNVMLNANIGEIISIDSTLTQPSEAAEAKAVGDEFNIRTFRVNISKYAADGTLDNSSFAAAFAEALEASKYIYIPDGNYDFDTIGKISVTDDIDVLCSDNAIFSRTTGTDWMFDFQQCTVKWNGGTFQSGTEGSKVLLYNSSVNGYNGGAINIKQCESAEICNINSPYSNLPAVIIVENSNNVNIHHCDFHKSVFSAVHILREGVNIVVSDCVFDTIYIPTNIGDEGWYCYAVCTGLRSLSDKDGDIPWTPPEGLVYTRNIVRNSEDSGLDTHGACNVEISNNVITNCNTCITAYEDSNRVARPVGWKMSNVKIVNNICVSNFVNSFGKHSYIMVACYNPDVRSCENWIIENNVFETPNGSLEAKAVLDLQRLENVVVRNNIFTSKSNNVEHAISVTKTSNAEIINNIFEDINGSAVIVGQGSNAIIKSNIFARCKYNISQASSTYSYIEGDDSLENIHRTVKGGVPYLDVVNAPVATKVSNSYGIALNAAADGAVLNGVYDATDKTVTFASATYLIVGQRLAINDGSGHMAYVAKIISDKKMVVTGNITSGNVTVTPKAADIVTVGGAS